MALGLRQTIRLSGEISKNGTLPPTLQIKRFLFGRVWMPANQRMPISSSLSVRKSPRSVATAFFTTISIPPRTSIVFSTACDSASGFRKSSDSQTAIPL